MSVTDSSGTEQHVYTYDRLYQVTAVDYPAGYNPALATACDIALAFTTSGAANW